MSMDHVRALEERTKELEGLRRQLAREEEEKHELFSQINSLIGEIAQLKQDNETPPGGADEISTLRVELDEFKLDFGKKQAELQRANEQLTGQREDALRRDRMVQLERQRMEEELRERDELLRELTETGDELGRALNEANNDLQTAREQLASVQQELALTTKHHHSGGKPADVEDQSTLHQLDQFRRELAELSDQLELAEQRASQGELEVSEKAELLRQRTAELERANEKLMEESERTAHLIRQIEELEQRLKQQETVGAEINQELERVKTALNEERAKHSRELEESKNAAATTVEATEQQNTGLIRDMEAKLTQMEDRNVQLSTELLAEQKRAETLLAAEVAKHRAELAVVREESDERENNKTELTRLEEDNVRLATQLLAEQQRSEEALRAQEAANQELALNRATAEEAQKTAMQESAQKLAQLEAENCRLATELLTVQKSVESALRAERATHEAELNRAKAALEASAAEEANRKAAEQSDGSAMEAKFTEMEKENMRLTADLLAEQQRAEREQRQQRAELDTLRAQLVQEREGRRRAVEEAAAAGQRTPLAAQSPEPPATPTAKPRRKTLNGNGGGSGSPTTTNGTGEGDDDGKRREAEEQLTRLNADLDKQKRLVTVLRKKLQQQQLDAMRRDREGTAANPQPLNGR